MQDCCQSQLIINQQKGQVNDKCSMNTASFIAYDITLQPNINYGLLNYVKTRKFQRNAGGV